MLAVEAHALAAVGGLQDGVAFGLKGDAQNCADVGGVVDEEEDGTHLSELPTTSAWLVLLIFRFVHLCQHCLQHADALVVLQLQGGGCN